MDDLIARVARFRTYDEFVKEFGPPEFHLSGAELRMEELLARLPSEVVRRYESGPARVRQAHWRIGELITLVVFEHADGSVAHQIGFDLPADS